MLVDRGETPRLGLLSSLEDCKAGGALAERAGLLQERGNSAQTRELFPLPTSHSTVALIATGGCGDKSLNGAKNPQIRGVHGRVI